MPSAVAGTVTRWRARYVDNAGREHARAFDRKVNGQKWIEKQLSALLRGDHVAPKDAKLTVGECGATSGSPATAPGASPPSGRPRST